MNLNLILTSDNPAGFFRWNKQNLFSMSNCKYIDPDHG